MMPAPLGVWTDDRISELKLYAEQGYTCSQIAAMIGNATRNSVIGKLHRLGLTTKNEPGGGGFKKTKRPPRSRVAKSRIVSTRWASDGKVKPPLNFAELRGADLVPLHISFEGLTANSCRFPYGEGPYTYCGHDTLSVGSYCDQHQRIVYRQPGERALRPDTTFRNLQTFANVEVLRALDVAEEAA